MSEYLKPAASYAEQLSILKSRNLIINNETEALNKLRSIGYFRLSGYWLTFYEKKDVFLNGTTFEQVMEVYDFDLELKNIVFELLENTEINLRALIAHHFAHHHDPLGHYNPLYFVREDWYQKWNEESEEQIKRAGSRKELFVPHYKSKYNGIFPIWTILEMASFGNLSKFYNNLTNPLKNEISKNNFGVHFNYLSSWLYVFSVVRNMCAHNSRLYDRKLDIKPKLTYAEHGYIDNSTVFSVILIARKVILDENKWQELEERLFNLITKCSDCIDIKKVGFPNEWQKTLRDAKK